MQASLFKSVALPAESAAVEGLHSRCYVVSIASNRFPMTRDRLWSVLSSLAGNYSPLIGELATVDSEM